MSVPAVGFHGPLPPERFNMAAYCLAPNPPREPSREGLVVVADADAPAQDAERWSYQALDDAVRGIAAGLRELGLARGDRIMLRFGNTSDYALLFFAAIAAGAIALPSSAQLTEEEAQFILSDSQARAVAMADDLRIEVPGSVLVVTPADVAAWRESSVRAEYVDTAADEPAFLVYTSGTTGTPKGVLHAHRSAWGRRPMYEGWYGIRQEDVMLHAGAFNWTYTLGVGLTDPWANGATSVIYNGPKDPAVWPSLMAAYQATLFAAVPGVYRQILKYTDISGYDLGNLRHCLVAGEALSPALREAWLQETGTELYEALGMSECSTFISSSPTVPVRPGSPGRPQQGRSVAVLPVEGGDDPAPPGTTGLLAVHRSDPGLMLGYWNRPEEQAEVFRGEWFCGGDLVDIDADGYVSFHGRSDDLMNAGGYRVSPLEVEAVLSQHPVVADVAVCEVTVREGVSVIAAFVVVNDHDDPDSFDGAGLMDHAARHLARYKRPREIIFVDTLPRTANGKVLRRELAGHGWGESPQPTHD